MNPNEMQDIKLEEWEQKNIHDEGIGTEYILIFNDHPYFFIKEILEFCDIGKI